MRENLIEREGCGVLAHILSLPSNYGIGTIGQSAFSFVDFLSQHGFSFWQVLPCGVTSYGDSPYQSASMYAFNPYFIDLDDLCERGYLDVRDIEGVDFGVGDRVDYYKLFLNRKSVLKKAVDRFFERRENEGAEYKEFLNKNAFWLDDFSVFMAIKESFSFKAFFDWDDYALMHRDIEAIYDFIKKNIDSVYYHRVVQFFFDVQWKRLVEYAKGKNVKIIGDIPFYVAHDSAEVWSHPELFNLNEKFGAKKMAGVPPDAFSAKGQLWGNPTYNWAKMREGGYEFWKRRIEYHLDRFDYIRIDHFRGFSAFYEIDEKQKSAKNGRWVKGEGIEFFKALNLVGDKRIIAEDLGIYDDNLRELLQKTGFKGTRVAHFAFSGDSDNMHLRQNFNAPCAFYAGTHDNTTTRAWFRGLTSSQKEQFIREANKKKGQSAVKCMLDYLINSKAEIVIFTIQDLLNLGKEARMNHPSTTRGNWVFRMPKDYANRVYLPKGLKAKE